MKKKHKRVRPSDTPAASKEKDACNDRSKVQLLSNREVNGQCGPKASPPPVPELPRVEAEANADWDKGLPLDVLALMAAGRDDMEVMRVVCSTWRQGYERSVTSIRISHKGPPLYAARNLPERFSSLTALDIGECSTRLPGAQDAAASALPSLRRLSLGHPPWVLATSAAFHLSDGDLSHLQGTHLTHLSLAGCARLTDRALVYLWGLPLSHLDLGWLKRLSPWGLASLQWLPLCSLGLLGSKWLTAAALGTLGGLPLTALDLSGCQGLQGAALRRLWALPLQRLGLGRCWGLAGNSLEGLQGLPLSDLDLSCNAWLEDAALAHLQGLPLRTLRLDLPADHGQPPADKLGVYAPAPPAEADEKLTDAALQHLRGLPLTDLSLAYWRQLSDSGLRVLQGLPLASLGPDGLSGPGFEGLAGAPLVRLSLAGCSGVRDEGLVWLVGGPLAELDLAHCRGLSNAAGQTLLRMRALRRLSVFDTRFSPACLEMLRGLVEGNGGRLQAGWLL